MTASNARGRRTIEIAGVHYPNMGDCLMLLAAEEGLKSIDPGCRFVTKKRRLPAALRERFQLEAVGYVPVRNGRLRLLRKAGNYVARSRHASQIARTLTGRTLYGGVQVLVDLCGYNHFNADGADSAWQTANALAEAKADGKKIILMPRTFGPFGILPPAQDHRLKAAMARIVSVADLCFVRDEVSMRWLEALGVSLDRVKPACDYTAAVPGSLRREHEKLRGRACVIPNYRIAANVTDSSVIKYVAFVRDMIADLRALGHNPYVLLHEYENDLQVGGPLAADPTLDVIQEGDPLFLKGLIGSARLVIGSRYHGIISGLSQGVPTVILGWVHKYDGLATDYNVPDLLARPPLDDALRHIRSIVELLTKSSAYEADVRLRIGSARTRILRRNRSMWDLIAQELWGHIRENAAA